MIRIINRFISNWKRPFDRLRVIGHGELVGPSRRLTKTFALIDSHPSSEKARNNHIYFRFTGGATDISKRSRRIELIARILREYGFSMKIQGNLIIARLSNIGQSEMEDILDQTGRLIAFTRQLDAVLHDEERITRYTEKFLAGDYTL